MSVPEAPTALSDLSAAEAPSEAAPLDPRPIPKDVPIATFEFLGSAGEALVVPVPTSSGLFGESDFWVCIATSSSLQPIGWVRFERRGVFQAKALFEATELRSGDCEAPDPERVLQLWQYLAQGGL